MSKVKLKRVRASLGLSQQALSTLSGVSKPTIVEAEKGRLMRLLTAYAILKALNSVRSQQGLPELTVDDIEWNIGE